MLFVCRTMLIFYVAITLLVCGACSQQRWRFAPPNPAYATVRTSEASYAGNMGESVALPAQQSPRTLPRTTFPSQVGKATPPPQWQQAPAQPYVAAKPNFEANQQQTMPSPPTEQPGLYPEPTTHDLLAPYATADATPSVRPVSNPTPVSNPMISQTVGAGLDVPYDDPCSPDRPFFHPRSICQDVCSDYRNYYTCCNLRGYLYAIAGGSLLANTSLDDDFHNWYQRDVRSEETDHFADFWKTFGEGEYVVPFFACTAVVGKALDQFPVADMVGEHGYRTTRAYLVGVPPMVFSQHLLGGSRPNENPHESMWRPFNDNNGVSGHAFMGAVPFITAAQMSEGCLTKIGFYTLSTFPAWSRVNDDAHYLSQVCLGWYMAYMACRSVNQTACHDRCLEVVPICQPGGAGVVAIWKR